jgi:hypothetical protein
LAPDDIASARAIVVPWHKDVVSSLRAARRHLKAIGTPGADTAKAAADLRTQVTAAELESERIEQMILEQWANAQLETRPRGNPRETVLANLQALLGGHGSHRAQSVCGRKKNVQAAIRPDRVVA